MKYLLLIALACFSFSMHSQNKPQDRPNILWLSAEDMGPLLSSYGAAGINTPNIDRLAKEGVRYSHAYATVGVCGPSRSSIITAMYPVRIGSHNMRTGDHYRYHPPEEESYQTYIKVKDAKGQNVPEYSVVPPSYVKCFTEYLRTAGYYCTNNYKCDYQFNCPITAWDEVGNEASYKNRLEDMPFFSVINDHVTHESRIWKKKDDPLLAEKENVVVPNYFPDIPVVRKDLARKYSNIIELDEHIGEIMDNLEKEGLLKNTIIFFWSDHGGPLLRQKRAVGNSGLQVPLIVRFPDKRLAGTVNDDIISLMDLGPTVLSLAGIKPPGHMDGKAFLGEYKEEPHTYAFGSADRFDETTDMARSVIDGRYVYIKNFRPELPLVYRLEYRENIDMMKALLEMDKKNELSGDAGYIFMKTKPLEELYDLQVDPYEVHNVAEDPKYRSKLLELREALGRWQLDVGDKGFIPEHDLVRMMWPGNIQPETSEVVFKRLGDRNIELSSSTSGASIAYMEENKNGTSRWKLYSEPIALSKGTSIAARAVRLGYKTSEITRLDMN
ncbi:MAG: sulfatase-like hydrolase/transferase [Leeuwenhoekiella sp.]